MPTFRSIRLQKVLHSLVQQCRKMCRAVGPLIALGASKHRRLMQAHPGYGRALVAIFTDIISSRSLVELGFALLGAAALIYAAVCRRTDDRGYGDWDFT